MNEKALDRLAPVVPERAALTVIHSSGTSALRGPSTTAKSAETRASSSSTSSKTPSPFDASCCRSHATICRARPAPIRGTGRHQLPPRRLQNATRSPSVLIPSPFSRSHTSGRNPHADPGIGSRYCKRCRLLDHFQRNRAKPCAAVLTLRGDRRAPGIHGQSRGSPICICRRYVLSHPAVGALPSLSSLKYRRAIATGGTRCTNARSAVSGCGVG